MIIGEKGRKRGGGGGGVGEQLDTTPNECDTVAMDESAMLRVVGSWS